MSNALVLRDTLAPTSFGEVTRFAELVERTSFVPQAYRGKPGEIVAAIIYGADLGFTPMQALQNIAVVNGKPSVYGDGLRALILGRADCEGIDDDVSGEGEQRRAAVTVRRKGKSPVTRTFSMADAKRAGLLGKAGPWTQYTDRMLLMRAQGFAIRDAYADVLRGIITAEEAADYPAPRGPEAARDVTPPAWSHPSATVDTQEAETVEFYDHDGTLSDLAWVDLCGACQSHDDLKALAKANGCPKVADLKRRGLYDVWQQRWRDLDVPPADTAPTELLPVEPTPMVRIVAILERAADADYAAAVLADEACRLTLRETTHADLSKVKVGLHDKGVAADIVAALETAWRGARK